MLSEWGTGTTGVNQDCCRKTRTLDHPLLITHFSPDFAAILWTSPDNFFSFRVLGYVLTEPLKLWFLFPGPVGMKEFFPLFSAHSSPPPPGLFWFMACGGNYSTYDVLLVDLLFIFFKRNNVLCVSDPVLDCFWEFWL